VTLARVDWFDPRAVALRAAMDAETGAMYAEFTAGQTAEVQAAIDDSLVVDPAAILVTLLALDGDVPVGHTALRPVVPQSTVSTSSTAEATAEALEVKKVFVPESARGRGVARLLMLEAEAIARDRGVASLVLQTGPLQVPAIRLYEDLGYVLIPAFGKYGVIPGALCYEKVL